MATILQRLKDQLKEYGEDTSGIQTISQALKKLNDPNAIEEGYAVEVTGNTISECLDDISIGVKLPSKPSDSGKDDGSIK